MARLNYSTAAPEIYKKLVDPVKYFLSCGLDEKILHMVLLRTSQINGCSYCVDIHWRDAKKSGVDLQKLNAVVVWRKTPFFTDKERAALLFAEAMTVLKDQQVSDADYEEVQKHFAEKELADLAFAIAHMNALNRMAVTFKVMPAKEAA